MQYVFQLAVIVLFPPTVTLALTVLTYNRKHSATVTPPSLILYHKEKVLLPICGDSVARTVTTKSRALYSESKSSAFGLERPFKVVNIANSERTSRLSHAIQ